MPACEIVLRACRLRLSVAGFYKYPATLTPGIEGRQLGTNRQHERLDSDRPVGAYPPGGGVATGSGVDQLRVRTGAALSESLPLSARWQRPQPEPDSEAAAP